MAVTLNGAALTASAATAASPAVLTWTSAVLTAGDILVVVTAGNTAATTYPTIPAPTGGTSLAWASIVLENNTAAHFSTVRAYWTAVPSGQTSTITQSNTVSGTNIGAKATLYRLSGADTVTPVGQTGVFQGQTDPTGTSLQITGTATGSMIFMGGSDWSAGTATLTSTISGVGTSTTDFSSLESTQFRGVMVHGDQSASTNQGTLDYSAATGDWAAALFEIKAPAGAAAQIPTLVMART